MSYSHIGVVNSFNEVASIDHFQTYLSIFRPDITGFTFNVLSVDGDTKSQASTPSVLADAFIQVTAGLASKVPMTVIAVGTETSDGPVSIFSDITIYTVSDLK